MATTRKDLRGRTLRKGEMQRSSINGIRIPIKIRWDGANTSTQMTL